ncbi:MAG: two component transcriptional regulator, LuxR family, partial [Dehalococcoidia bacterium]|nr:two component transcriptional regulator, LuxR family [Dehalococcoidia bacterium]
MAALRVLVIADDPLARAGLAALLSAVSPAGNGHDNLAVVGQVSAGVDLLSDLDMYRPDVAVWDFGWGAGSVSERLPDLREAACAVVALVADEAQAGEAWMSGAKGVMPRDATAAAVTAALQAVGQGLSVVASDYRDTLRPKELRPSSLA